METTTITIDTLEELQGFIRNVPKGTNIGTVIAEKNIVHFTLPDKTKVDVVYTGPIENDMLRMVMDAVVLKRNAEEETVKGKTLNQSINSFTVENIDISNDEEPVLYIQRYKYPERTYRVIRKEWDEDVEGEFIPDPDYSESYWCIDTLLLAEYDPEDEFTEIFASVDRDEEHPPLDDPEEVKKQNSDPCFHVVYDPEDKCFKCEPTGDYGEDVTKASEQDEEAFEQIAAPTLRAAIDQGIAVLDRLIENSVK